ncbi:TetR/AcrR family transcriptional regulator [Desulforhopalus vacuolatus]|uniref:TetR/AcrR family transcriptional regulator n=1 Tax=Desulforhopalus vacuolatus TaxID=40414 RepID=UPI001966A169|nr:TetR/AcrR family transcriptional regulator [Desulforhopalus vacuolatus]MBM9519906.1 TetR/AcrR family transcriptional regulator [Desulforhopalus vacuolatus]
MAKALFKRNEVIDKSMLLFCRKGFKASSMQQIVETTGLKPGSIYHSFGNKEALFREVLTSYSAKSMAKVRETIDGAESIDEGILLHLKNTVAESINPNYCSCLLVKTQLELAADENKNNLHDFAANRLKKIESLFRSYLEHEYDEETSSERAVSIMLHIFGVRIYGYQQGSAELMLKGLRAGLPWLPWD